jgi:hypothetical protein
VGENTIVVEIDQDARICEGEGISAVQKVDGFGIDLVAGEEQTQWVGFQVPGCWIRAAVYGDAVAFLDRMEGVIACYVLPDLDADLCW